MLVEDTEPVATGQSTRDPLLLGSRSTYRPVMWSHVPIPFSLKLVTGCVLGSKGSGHYINHIKWFIKIKAHMCGGGSVDYGLERKNYHNVP